MRMDHNYNCDNELCCSDFTFSSDEDFRNFFDANFTAQIRAMMYSFGDAKEPLEESVIVVKSILRKDMNNLLKEAESIAQYIRESEEISHKDLLFLLRRNKGKLKHLIEYLQELDKMHTLKLKSDFNDPDNNKKKESVDKCIEYLKSIEDCKEYTSALKDETIIDPTHWNVLMKRNWLAKFMDKEEYLQYTQEVLRSSFHETERISCFKIWLLDDKVITLPLTSLACTIIRFLARETIAKIVDLALQVQKKRAELYNKHNNDFYRYTQIAFDAITDSFSPRPRNTEIDKTFTNRSDNSNIVTNDKNIFDNHFSDNWPGCSQSIVGEYRKDSDRDFSNSSIPATPSPSIPAEKDDYSDETSCLDSESENSASKFVIVEDSKSSDACRMPLDIEEYLHHETPVCNFDSSLDEISQDASTAAKQNNEHNLNISDEEDTSPLRITSSAAEQNNEHGLNISDEEDTSRLRINHSWEERFNKRTAITVEEIRQAYTQFQKYHVLWNRDGTPKPRLLCTD